MRSVILRLAIIFVLGLSIFALAQTAPNLPGFPSAPASSNGSSSGGSNFWADAGSGYVYLASTLGIFNPDAGPTLFAGPNTISGVISNSVQLGTPSGSGADYAALTFTEGVTSAAFANGTAAGAIWGQRGSSAARPMGMNYVSGHFNLGGNGHTFSSGADPTQPAAKWARISGGFGNDGLITVFGSANNPAIQLANNAWLKLGTGTNDYFKSDGTGTENPGYLEVGGYVQGATGLCSGTACVGTAFGSFPAAAGVPSRFLYDSTNLLWRYSNGTNWLVVDKEWIMCAYAPNGSPAASRTVSRTTTASISKTTALTVVSIAGPTSVTGNITFTIFDVTAAAALCTLTKACNTGNDTTACSADVPAAHVIDLREDSSGCGAGTVSDYNITAQFNGG